MSLITNRYAGLWTTATGRGFDRGGGHSLVLRFGRVWRRMQAAFLPVAGRWRIGRQWSPRANCELPDDFRRGVMYTSNQAHHSVDKAAILAGLPRANLRKVPVDEQLRVTSRTLLAAFATIGHRDVFRWQSLRMLARRILERVDDLESLADLAADERIWLHVDAAYGGFFLLTERGRAALRGIERADSVTLDPHKGLFLPYGTGCLAGSQSRGTAAGLRACAANT